MKHSLALSALALAGALTALNAAPDILIENFERDTYAPWTVEGAAFGDAPDSRPRAGQNYRFVGVEGQRLANSFTTERGDVAKGKLISPEFKIQRNYIVFKIAGGEMPGALAARLVVDGNVVRTQTPYRTRELLPAGWDVSEFKGKTAHFEIEDRARGNNWDEFIMVDDIRQSDRPAVVSLEREVPAQGYLNVPICRMGIKSMLEVLVDGKPVLRTPIMPANPDNAETWASVPLGEYAGKRVSVKIDNLSSELADAEMIRMTDELIGSENLYQEALRPQFHVSAQRGWVNDPNGMVYADGKWHLYFQHDPYSLNGLTKYWGHAVSEDLVHWKELPTAIRCFIQAQGKVYSGSALVDVKNRSGYGKDGKGPLIGMFTDTGFGEALVYSNDGGLTFTYIPENPVYQHRGRDPKIIWYPAEEARTQDKGHFVMAVFSDTPDRKRVIDILTSDNLRDWEKTDTVEGYFECPELFYLPLLDANGNPTGEHRWVITAADGEHQIGEFDGEKFTAQTGKQKTEYGAGYAGQCFSQAPDGRVVRIAWLRIGWNGMPFTQMFSVPMEMSLRKTADGGMRLYAYPVEELKQLRGQSYAAQGEIGGGSELSLPARGQTFDIECVFDAPKTGKVVLALGRERVVYDAASQKVDGAPLAPVNGKISLRVLLDRTSIEIFGNGGEICVARRRADMGADADISLEAEDGARTRAALTAYEMGTIWQKR